jgi:signal transduction histidine kinase
MLAVANTDPKFLCPGRILAWMVLTILLVIGATEFVEIYLQMESDVLEGAMHVLVLSGTLAPVFYFLWYRPLVQQMTERQHSENEVRTLSHRLLAAADEERRKLARDLHDEFGQKLISLQMLMDNLQQAVARGERPSSEACGSLTELTREIGTDLRAVIANLRPGVLEELGLVAAIEGVCSQIMTGQAGLQVSFSCNGIRGRLAPEVETVLFRVCQEALTNVVRHAGAHRVEVQLTCSYPDVILLVQDDGAGLPAAEPGSSPLTGHFGLIGMRERVASVGGTLRMSSEPGRGTRIRVAIPATQLETE